MREMKGTLTFTEQGEMVSKRTFERHRSNDDDKAQQMDGIGDKDSSIWLEKSYDLIQLACYRSVAPGTNTNVTGKNCHLDPIAGVRFLNEPVMMVKCAHDSVCVTFLRISDAESQGCC